jgi:hypothetical protein
MSWRTFAKLIRKASGGAENPGQALNNDAMMKTE